MRSEDAEQLAAHWTASQSEVTAFLRSIVAAGEVADLLQQIAVKLVRNYETYDPQRPFVPWAIGIAKHEVLAWRRKQANDRLRFSDDVVGLVADAFTQSVEQERDLEDALRACMKQLKGRGRKAIDLHYGRGMKTDHVAAALNISGGAVRMLLCRVRESLRQCIHRRMAAGAD